MNDLLVAEDLKEKQTNSDWIAPDTHGQNFFEMDQSLQGLLKLYLPEALREHMTPHYSRLGEIAGGKLDELARMSDKHAPVLHARDPFGRDEDWLEFHPSYREMEQIGFGDFGIHCMSRTPGVLGWQDKVPPLAKYIFQYLFVQSEFGLMCPISATDTSAMLIERYGDEATKNRFLPGMHSNDMNNILKGAQFMTEKTGGSDVGQIELTAKYEDGEWRLYGDKWFCSHTDSSIILILARSGDPASGSKGLSLFLVPRWLEDGSRNAYRTLRLKPKMGTKSMATGEVRFEGAVGYLLGEEGRGLRQTMDQVNLSRLSHGVRAAAMMRRCLNEALTAARGRTAFGKSLDAHPLMARQLLKIMLPTEQALSAFLYTAAVMEKADAGDETAATVLRLLTPLIKFRACRDNIPVATAAMEVRGGNGFIEDWVNARLVRDAHTGVLWEGTSSIVALDVARRAVPQVQAHKALGAAMHGLLDSSDGLPGQFGGELAGMVDRAVAFADEVAREPESEAFSRQATNALYHAMTATLLAHEGAIMAKKTGDARRMLLARLVIDHRMRPHDPMSLDGGRIEREAGALLLRDAPVSLEDAVRVLAS